MAISLKPEHLKRYAQIARLLYKYGRSDLVQATGLQEALEATGDEAPPPARSARDRRGSVARRDLDDAFRQAIDQGLVVDRRKGDGRSVSDADDERRALDLASDLERLGPTYIKLGQLMSTRADIIPPVYLPALARLQDRIEPVLFEDVRRIVEEELGIRLSKAFHEFDPDPIGSASLGQVHRAVLRDGRPVAVKVQRPAIWDRIREDLDALRELADLVEEHTDFGHRYRPRQVLEELRRALLRELDYRQEARHLERLSRNLREFDRIVVPRPVDDFTTSRVLTMDYVRGRKITSLSPLARIELDGEQLADTLFSAYLNQILVDGFFHADPHPGNVFLTDDGRIALIDLGMVAHLGPELQERLLKLLLAISDGAGEDVAAILLDMAELSVGAQPQEFRKEVVDLVARNSTSGTEGVQVGSIFLVVNRTAAEHGVLVPSALTMLGKTLLNLDEVGRTLDPAFDPNAAIRRHAASVMQKRMLRKLSPGELFSTALELNEFVQRLPGRLNRMLDTVSANELEFRVHAIDEERLIAGIQKIANRITVGLILAALIVGAAMLVRVETSATILGYPALAMLLFLAAAAGGTALVISIIHGDRH